jgi:mRNA interferase RelE/StbE
VYKVLYHERVVSDDIPSLSTSDAKRVRQAIEDKLLHRPETFGRPLRRSLRGYKKLRVGDYRVVFRIDKSVIYILAIRHRSVIYKQILKRLEQ